METINDAAMLEASNLTAAQLREVINLVNAEFDPRPEGGDHALIAAVRGTLARNYGMQLAAAGR